MLIPVSARTLRRSPIRSSLALALLLALLLIPQTTALYPFARPAGIPALPAAPAASAPAPSDAMAALPAQMRAMVFAQLGRDDPAAHLHATADGSIRAPAVGGLAVTFDATTLRLGGPQPTWQWTLRGWGRATALVAPTQATAVVQANQARYAQGGLESWYIAGRDRLEQGWTIATRPTGAGPLLLRFAEGGRLHAEPTGDGQALDLRDAAGESSLRYDGLLASDASGRTLPARFTRHGDGLAITVDDRAARYPLTIDPWVQAATLTAQAGADQLLGAAVALSADGSTLAASSSTVIAIYTRPAGGWASAITPLATLTIPGVAKNSGERGRSLALSADGSTLVAGPAVFTIDTVGAVDVYVRPAGGWANTSTPSATLPNPTGAVIESFGQVMALSPDGATLIVGARGNPAGGIARGAAFVYAKPAGGWASTSTPTATLTNVASVDYDLLGQKVALSGDGSAFLVARNSIVVYTKPAGGWASTSTPAATLTNGAELGNDMVLSADGSTCAIQTASGVALYIKPAGGWANTSTPSATLTNAAGAAGDGFGQVLALSADGSTLAAGMPASNLAGTEAGAVAVYTRPAGGWATSNTPSAILTFIDPYPGHLLGYAVALSADGSTLIGGAPGNRLGVGAGGGVELYSRPAGGWASTSDSTATFISVSDKISSANFGQAVALSADSSTLIVHCVGGFDSNVIYVYTRPAGGWATSDAPTATLIQTDKSLRYPGLFLKLTKDITLSADGSTIVARSGFGGESFWVAVYVRPAGGWANAITPTAKLTNTSRGNDQDNSGVGGSSLEGKGLALTADGSLIFVGGPAKGNEAVAVFTRPAGGWVSSDTPTATLTDATVAGDSSLSNALALSADGNTLVASAASSDFAGTDRGALVLFTRPAGGWVNTTTASAILTDASNPGDTYFGYDVALNADGSTLAVGHNPLTGVKRILVYVKPAGGWATTDAPNATLTHAAGLEYEHFGNTVALSADGSTLIAAPYADPSETANPGVVAVFTRPAEGWVSSDTPTTTFALPNGKLGDRFGNSVALSADGRTLAVGTPRFYLPSSREPGSVYVYRNFLTNASLSGLSLSQGTLSPAFAAATRAYAASVPYNVSSLTVTPTLAVTTATVTVNGAPVTSGSASGPISLNVGANVISVVATAEDGTTHTTTITVTRSAGSFIRLPVIVR
jgi:hypothetical protein